jgi:hypothetical protein
VDAKLMNMITTGGDEDDEVSDDEPFTSTGDFLAVVFTNLDTYLLFLVQLLLVFVCFVCPQMV